MEKGKGLALLLGLGKGKSRGDDVDEDETVEEDGKDKGETIAESILEAVDAQDAKALAKALRVMCMHVSNTMD